MVTIVSNKFEIYLQSSNSAASRLGGGGVSPSITGFQSFEFCLGLLNKVYAGFISAYTFCACISM